MDFKNYTVKAQEVVHKASEIALGNGQQAIETLQQYGHKIDVLAATWKGEPDAGEKLYRALFRFNELRNAVAHGDRTDLVEGSLTRLLDAYRAIDPEAGEHIKIGELAVGICSFMADGPGPKQLLDMFEGLDKLVNVTMPAALGFRPDDDARR